MRCVESCPVDAIFAEDQLAGRVAALHRGERRLLRAQRGLAPVLEDLGVIDPRECEGQRVGAGLAPA